MSAHPLQDAIIMNVGDLLQRWSNGKLRLPLPKPNVTAGLISYGTRHTQINAPSSHTTTKTGPVHGGRTHDTRALLDTVLCRSRGRDDGGVPPSVHGRETCSQVPIDPVE